ncbi:aldose 1-epimerase [Reichenbachiella versicolor]|uniref:aldose 1-epimerase n=1 Tax=Reichenbachiella versicolor TaxID=1821036 RepID=UPI000D6E5FB2|nr:hypothetical protein [Reichenbachiella versicolor]
MFKVEKVAYGRFNAHRLVDTSNGRFLEVLSDFGAGINDLGITNSDGNTVSVLSGYRSEDDIRLLHHTKFAGSKLSPIPNRTVDGQFQFNGQDYQFSVNEFGNRNQLHGLLHNVKFEEQKVVESDEKALLELKHGYLGTAQGFPFSYTVSIIYTLNVSGVEIKTVIDNTGSIDMPIGDGWHPYFKFENLNEVELHMGAAERVSSLVNNPLKPVHGFENASLIGELALDDCFKVSESNDKFNVRLKDARRGLEFSLWQTIGEGQYKYCQIYTPPSRKEIAIEPVSCPPNALNTKDSIVVLSVGQSNELSIGINFNS